ncbi:MAG: amidohydrolase family protein [Opitutus sp.]|nr:amidohydrolase family protein [Opitutus sp.]
MASTFDIIVRGGWIVTPEGLRREDLAIADGRVAARLANLAGDASQVIDASGSYVFPGFIDAHVHFNEPGRADWEGLGSGSAALAAGGGTCFFDMPLNSEPPVLDAVRFHEKEALAREKSHTDFALWGGLTPANLDRLAELRDAGAIGLKAFMSESGIASFERVDEPSLRAGMQAAAQLGLIVAVHAEDNSLAARHTAEKKPRLATRARISHRARSRWNSLRFARRCRLRRRPAAHCTSCT